MVDAIDFQPYIQSLCRHYAEWWTLYTLTDIEGRKVANSDKTKQIAPFDFGLMVRSVNHKAPEASRQEKAEKPEQQPVLKGLRDSLTETKQVLLIGRPGSGKSTALARLLLEEAQQSQKSIEGTPRIPVLVELRYYQTSIIDLIREFFRRHDLLLETHQVETLLSENRLLLLIDGLNELSSKEAARQDITKLRNYRNVPMVFTTRDLSLGGDFGIEKQWEMLPLTEPQMQEFIRSHLSPDQANSMWRQLKDRTRKFAETPLLLWMLCELFQAGEEIPRNLGEVFRIFTRTYENSSIRKHEVAALKGDVRPLGDRRLWFPALKHLAYTMMQGETPVDSRTVISRTEAEREFKALFRDEPHPAKTARDCLDDLLNYHLLQVKTDDEIEFRHQLLQEYYAAEWLFDRLPELSDEQLKYYFLNYLKWTEAIGLMLGLPEVTEKQALEIVELALNKVDLMLGARLAGTVKLKYQEQTVGRIASLIVPMAFKVELLGETRSKKAIPYLLQALEAEDEDVYKEAARWLGDLEAKVAIPKLQNKLSTLNSFIQESCTDKDVAVWMTTVEALGKLSKQDAVSELQIKILQGLDHPFNFFILFGAGKLLRRFDDESILPELFVALEDESSHIRRANAASVLGQIGNKRAISELINALADQHPFVRKAVVNALEQFATEEALSGLTQALTDQHHSVYENAAQALVRMKHQAAVPGLLDLLHHPNCNVSWLAAVVLGHLGNNEALKKLQQEFSNNNSNTREVAIEALSQIGGQQVVSLLLDRLQNDPDHAVRRSAAIALGQLGNEKALRELLKALRHYYPNKPNGRIKTSVNLSSGQVVIQGISEEELKTLGDENAVQRWFWERNNLDIRIRIAKALANLGTEDAISGLFDGLKHSNACTRLAAAIALGQLGKKEAIQAIQELLDALRDVGPNTRKEIITALVKLGNQQIVLKLLELLKDNALDSDTRWSIAIALGQIEGNVTAEYLPDLIKLISTRNQWQALWAILAIQEQCRFYNYEIATQSNPPPAVKQDSGTGSQGHTINNNFDIKTLNANHSALNLGGTIHSDQIVNQRLVSNFVHSTVDRPDSLIQAKEVLEIIFNTGISLERSAREVRNLPEESLREFFIPSINAKFQGSATAETRNKNGKTDILVRIAGKNILIVECKFWGGDKKLKATLDQLLNRYTTVRDTQLAMLIFSRNKQFTDVKQKIPEAMKQYSSFIREVSIDLEKAWYEYVIFHPDDRACELNLTVFAFHLSP